MQTVTSASRGVAAHAAITSSSFAKRTKLGAYPDPRLFALFNGAADSTITSGAKDSAMNRLSIDRAIICVALLAWLHAAQAQTMTRESFLNDLATIQTNNMSIQQSINDLNMQGLAYLAKAAEMVSGRDKKLDEVAKMLIEQATTYAVVAAYPAVSLKALDDTRTRLLDLSLAFVDAAEFDVHAQGWVNSYTAMRTESEGLARNLAESRKRYDALVEEARDLGLIGPIEFDPETGIWTTSSEDAASPAQTTAVEGKAEAPRRFGNWTLEVNGTSARILTESTTSGPFRVFGLECDTAGSRAYHFGASTSYSVALLDPASDGAFEIDLIDNAFDRPDFVANFTEYLLGYLDSEVAQLNKRNGYTYSQLDIGVPDQNTYSVFDMIGFTEAYKALGERGC